MIDQYDADLVLSNTTHNITVVLDLSILNNRQINTSTQMA